MEDTTSALLDEGKGSETVKEESDGESTGELCENCGEPATVWCQQCTNYYCIHCSGARHQHPARRSHQLKSCTTSQNASTSQTLSTSKVLDQDNLRMLGVLAERFKLTQFKDWQVNAISAVDRGVDALVVQPTGSGKSLCFQFPAVWLKKSTIVITPTVSLMSDQSRSLESRGIHATFLGSAQRDKTTTTRVLAGEYEVIFVTPESFFDDNGTPKHLFRQLQLSKKIGLIAVDEAHLVCSWSSFRPKYEFVSGLHTHFPGIPLIALTATATPQVKEKILSVLRDPVQEISSVNKPNISLSVKKLTPVSQGSVAGDQNERRFTHIAQLIHPLIQAKRAIVYLDAAKHVPRLAIALRQRGLKSCGYHGKNMSSHDKLKALENWQTGEVEVMVSTSAFGMGIDRKDVDVVVKIGVPQSLEDLVQMFGRAGRDGRNAHGVLFYSEDDLQMASYWYGDAKDHSTLTKFQESWKFVYSDLIGKCRREVILEYFGEDSASKSTIGDCCDVCSCANRSVSDYQDQISIITQATSELSGTGEKKISEWIRGSQSEAIRNLTDVHGDATYGSGVSLMLSLDIWRTLIRQAWLLGLLERNMRVGVGAGKNKGMVFNTYQVSPNGHDFMRSPHEVCLLTLPDLESVAKADEADITVKKSTRETKGSQALPVIRRLLSDQTNWFDIEAPDDYQYPGIFKRDHPQRVAFTVDVTALPFYDNSNEHFLFEDIQLGKGNSRGVRQTTIRINETLEEVCYKIAPCKGVKHCGENGCKYIASTRESKPCPHHTHTKLQSSGFCPVDFYYVWPTNPEDPRRWVGGLVRSGNMSSKNLHNHPVNPPSKIPVKVEADIRRALLANPHLKTSEIMIGKGMKYMPGAASLAATHKGKIKNLRLQALHDHHADPRSCIMRFEKDAKEYDNSTKENIGVKGGHLETYQEVGHPYVQDYSVGKEFTWVLCMSPLMAQVMAKTDFIEVDATFKASVELDNLINVITFDYHTLQWMIVARIRLNKLDAAAYTTCFSALFHKVKELHPDFVVGETLKGILADWSDTQLKGLQDALGEETVSKVMKGCQVHFMRSVKKVADRLKECSDESRRVFIDLGYAILDAETKEEVESLFKVLCGEGGLEEVVEFLPNGARVQNYIRQHNPDHWSKCRKWSEWWRRPRHLSMLSSAFSEMKSVVFHNLPNSTNAVESYNRLCKGSTADVLSVAMMTTYRLDMAAALQYLAVSNGMPDTYEQQTPEARSIRTKTQNRARAKRRWNETDDAQGPPDKHSDFGGITITPRRKRPRRHQTQQLPIRSAYTLTEADIEELHEGKMLSDIHINSASALIHRDFPEIQGLHSTLNSQRQGGGFQPAGEGSIQILYCGDQHKHWVTTCCMDGKVIVYDSLPMKTLPEELTKQMTLLYGNGSTKLEVNVPVVQRQPNNVDCGCFAIAWAIHLAIGKKPELMVLDTKQLRSHLVKCFQAKKVTPFPRTPKKSQRIRSKNITLM